MPRATRPFLSVLLCLLVLSWGTSPCVLARALDLPAGNADINAETSCSDCCCKEESESSAPKPGECPICKSGKSLRDLPLPGSELALDAPADGPFLAQPLIDVPVLAGIETTTEWIDTGPPEGNALHACPVGIVLILS